MTKVDYLSKCNAEKVEDLTKEQVLEYFLAGYGGEQNQISAQIINEMDRKKYDYTKGIAFLRQAFDGDKNLRIYQVSGDGVILKGTAISSHKYEMILV